MLQDTGRALQLEELRSEIDGKIKAMEKELGEQYPLYSHICP